MPSSSFPASLGWLLLASLLHLPLAAELPPTAQEAVPLAAGALLPQVMVQDASGAAVDLHALATAQPTLLVVYRGGWCPFCNRHLGELAEIEPQLTALGYRVIALSPDAPEALAKHAAEHPAVPGRTTLSDRGMQASAALGLAFRVADDVVTRYRGNGIDLAPIPGEPGAFWLPVPAAYVISRDGHIAFAHADADFRQRVATAELLDAARAAVR